MIDAIKEQILTASNLLGLQLADNKVALLAEYLLMMNKWNKVYNLTAVRTINEMISHHIVDSLSVLLPLQRVIQATSLDSTKPINILDVGSGAGLPGVVIAICFPEYSVHCLDAVAKKMAFVRQVAATLDLKNLVAVHSRIECVATQYSVITSRAYASLIDFVSSSSKALSSQGVWMAMKGKIPLHEIEDLPNNIDMFHVEQIHVPGLEAERCIIWMKKRMDIV